MGASLDAMSPTARSHTTCFLVIAAVLALAGCSNSLRDSPSPQPLDTAACRTPRFPYEEGWLGGDSAYSVPLPGKRTLWLFGDTFVGSPGQPDRTGSLLVHNSIGLARCNADRGFEIDYFWGRASAEAPPRGFIPGDDAQHFYWLFDGFVFEGELFLGLLEVSTGEPRGPLNLPFRFAGMKIARIDRPEDDPRTWQPRLVPLTERRDVFVGAMLVHEGHLYLFAFIDRDATHHPRFLARLPVAALRDPGRSLPEAIETFHRDGSWHRGFDPDQAKILMDDNATEMSVHFDAERSHWVALYSHPNTSGRFPSDPLADAILLRTAARLEGPWSAPRVVHRVEELTGVHDDPHDPATICYGAKAHAQYTSRRGVPVTYTCNLYTPDGADPYRVLARLLGRMDLYQPRAVTLPLDNPEPANRPGQ